MLELIPIDESTLLEVADYKEEFVLNHEIIHGGAGLDLYDDLTQWLAHSMITRTPRPYVPIA